MTQKSTDESTRQDISPQLLALTSLIRLEQRIRSSQLIELRFVAVNESISLCQYHQAVLWESASDDLTRGKITAVSGISHPSTDSPQVNYISQLLRVLASSLETQQVITRDTISTHKDLMEGWQQWLPAVLLWQPFKRADYSWRGGLLLMREQPWNEGESALLNLAADAYAHRFAELESRDASSVRKKNLRKLCTRKTLYIVLLICMLPFRTSVLAPAEVIAQAPILIRSPIDGVIATIAVRPNQTVKAGDLLVSFDKAELTTKLSVAQKAQQVAELELRQTAEAAMNENTARNDLGAARGRVEQAKTDVGYYNDLLARADITAPQDGVVVFEDVFDWLGRPVSIGERIMILADPAHTELEISLPAGEWTSFPDQAAVSFFSNVIPYAPGHAKLYYVSYRSTETPEGTVAYKLRSKWDDTSTDFRLGQKGTAIIYSYRRPLIWHVLCKPLALIRQWWGW